MAKIVEFIPNFSEGRRQDVIDALVAEAKGVPGVILLDHSSDASHNRSVFTMVGDPDGVAEAAFRLVKLASEKIDMREHKGEHPRMGATDVVPFVPIQDVTMEECVALSKKVAERIWNELHIPSFLYESSASRPDRVNLAKVRKGQFEGMPEKLLQDEWAPDYGERKIHPTAGITAIGARPPQNPGVWPGPTIAKILEKHEYVGHTVNFRTYRKSFKAKKKLLNDPSAWKIFENTHEPIVETAVWERVQEIRKGKRRPVRNGKVSLFSGLVFCADCGNKLYLHTTKNESQDSFNCATYRNGVKNCTAHFIREITLYNLVLTHLRAVIAHVRMFEDAFVKQVTEQSAEDRTRELAAKQRTVVQHQKRIAELDLLFQRLFEENTAGRISDERYLRMSAAYEAEQAVLQAETDKLETELAQERQAAVNTERFITLVKSYTEIDALSPTVLHEFIDKIVVHAPDKSSGKRKQKVEIFYNAIGIFDVPGEDEMVKYFKQRKARRTAGQQQVKTA